MIKTLYSRRQQVIQRRLVDLRRAAGLNQRQMAKALNRERGLVSRLELGQRRVDLAEFYTICEACGANPVREAARIMREFRNLKR